VDDVSLMLLIAIGVVALVLLGWFSIR